MECLLTRSWIRLDSQTENRINRYGRGRKYFVYRVYRLMRVSECTGIQSILDWMHKGEWVFLFLHIRNIPFDTSKEKWDCVFCLMFPDSTRNHIRTCYTLLYVDLEESFIKGLGSESLFDSAPVIPLLLVNNNGIIPSYS